MWDKKMIELQEDPLMGSDRVRSTGVCPMGNSAAAWGMGREAA